MALAVELGLNVHQMDVTTAFLNGELEEEIYMELPDHLEEALQQIALDKEITNTKAKKMLRDLQSDENLNKVCLLRKALYGLRQAGRQWHKRLDGKLKKFGLTPLAADPCVYIGRREKDILLMAIYVDDIVIASQSETWIAEMKINLMQEFEMKDLGKIRHCLGFEFTHAADKIFMTQTIQILQILKRFGMEDSRPVGTPIDSGAKLLKPENPSREEMEMYPFRELIGSLMYLAVGTRPDIAYAISSLSQFSTCYAKDHWIAGKRVLRYLRGTLNHGIRFQRSKRDLEGFTDADWGACIEDRRSYTGFAFILGGGPVSWEAKKQRTVALSSTEAEYMALTEATKEAIHLKGFLEELGVRRDSSVVIFNDNQGAQKLAKNPIFHARTKHIDIRHHFVREALEHGLVQLEYLCTEEMIADVLTKGLPGPKHQKCLEMLGLGPAEMTNLTISA